MNSSPKMPILSLSIPHHAYGMGGEVSKGWSTLEVCAERDGCLANLLWFLITRVHTGKVSTLSFPFIMVNNDDGVIFLYPH